MKAGCTRAVRVQQRTCLRNASAASLIRTHDNVLAVQPGGDNRGDEELRAIGVGAGVGHGQEEGAGVLQLEVLIREAVAIDGLATHAVTHGEVAALEHEVGDHTVKLGA